MKKILILLILSMLVFVSCNIKDNDNINETDMDNESEDIMEITDFTEKTVINVKDYGAIGDGVSDDTEAFIRASEALYDAQHLYIPKGVYYITDNVTFSQSDIAVYGEGKDSHIIFEREQTARDTMPKASCFTFMRSQNIIVRDLSFEYKGTFFEKSGQSYSGKVSGIYVASGNNVLISNIESKGFNHSGIYTSSGKNITVENCDLHHNRVSGLIYGNVNGMLIQNNSFTYNGSELDGGTGYGVTGHSEAIPKNVKVLNNVANYNYRKGIDNHAGKNILIDGNTCHANRLYGIYAEGVNTADITITNNVITGMSSANSKLAEPYNAIYGIAVGVYNETNDGVERNYTVSNNKILGFDSGEGTTLALYVFAANDKGNIKITNNTVECKTVDYLFFVNRKSQNKDYNININFSDNTVSAENVRKDAFVFLAKNLDMQGNKIEFDKFGASVIIKAYGPSDSNAIIKNNIVKVSELSSNPSFATYSVIKPQQSGNTVNGKIS